MESFKAEVRIDREHDLVEIIRENRKDFDAVGIDIDCGCMPVVHADMKTNEIAGFTFIGLLATIAGDLNDLRSKQET